MCKTPRGLDSVGKTWLRGQKNRLGWNQRARVRMRQPSSPHQQEGDLIYAKGLGLPLSEVGDPMRGWGQHLQPTCRRTWWRGCQESRWKQA